MVEALLELAGLVRDWEARGETMQDLSAVGPHGGRTVADEAMRLLISECREENLCVGRKIWESGNRSVVTNKQLFRFFSSVL